MNIFVGSHVLYRCARPDDNGFDPDAAFRQNHGTSRHVDCPAIVTQVFDRSSSGMEPLLNLQVIVDTHDGPPMVCRRSVPGWSSLDKGSAAAYWHTR